MPLPSPPPWPSLTPSLTPKQNKQNTTKRPPPSELSNSFIITALQDLEPATIRGTEGITPCEYAVKRAKGLGQRHFSLVVTAYWKGGPHGVQGYGFKDVSPRYFEGYGFPDPTPAGVEAWKRGLQRCFKAAVAAGFTGLQVLNHIDAHDGSTWRNLLDFDPLAKYNGWSYEDVVVRPAAEALRAVVKPTTKVWFMVSGEMGRSVFGHPTSYLKLISKYRGALAERRAPGATKVGVALHWNKVCGNCFEMPRADTAAQYNATYAAVFARDRAAILPRFDLPMVRRVLEVSDVVGLSHYAPAPERGVAPGDFNAPIDTAAFELSFFGISLPDLIHKGGREFIFSEVGLGGADPSNARVASNLRELATNVHNGIWTVYNAAQDPWARADYRGFRREWFR